jgi:hypothetical protein
MKLATFRLLHSLFNNSSKDKVLLAHTATRRGFEVLKR